MKTRGFEICKGFKNNQINIPTRSTAHSAGYDFECAEDITIPSVFRQAIGGADAIKPILVKTGVKAYMLEDEALFLYNRSGNPFKKGLVMANSVGVVDSDYYSNPDNDGHIMFAFYNFFPIDVEIKKGERIGQGVFEKFLKTDDDTAAEERKGGFGSTKG